MGWAARDRLGIADRTLLVALAGPRYPAVSPWRERLDAWERAVAAQPGRPEAWYEYGDILMHRGPVLGIVGSAALAELAFARAVALDSSYAPPVSHLFELGAARGDTAVVEAAAALLSWPAIPRATWPTTSAGAGPGVAGTRGCWRRSGAASRLCRRRVSAGSSGCRSWTTSAWMTP